MLILLDAPQLDLVDLETAKLHCKVDDDAEDTLIDGYLQAAVALAERHTGLTLLPTEYEQWANDWGEGRFELQTAPVRDVLAVRYRDAAGNLQTLAPGDWSWGVTDSGAEVRIKAAPALSRDANAVRIHFAAGFDAPGASEADPRLTSPALAHQAILMLVGHWYAHRETVMEAAGAEPPFGATLLLDRITVYR